MSSKKLLLVALMLVLLTAGSGVQAGTDLNEVGAFLVYPLVAAFSFDNSDAYYGGQAFSEVETFVTITNAGSSAITAHVSYINGDHYDSTYCYECDFEIPLTGKDTETLVVTYGEYGISIESEDGTISRSCPHRFGFITVNVEDPATGLVLTDNVLLGEEVVVDYDGGLAFSVSAIPFQGKVSSSGDRIFDFDDVEYGKMPRVVAADFIAPDLGDDGSGISASLALFTLGFDRQFEPLTDCSVTGYDADEHPFSRSFQFGCWTYQDLCDLDPEFCYPNLSAGPCDAYGSDDDNPCDTHGWLQLNCRVDQDYDGIFDVDGGVHGAIVQVLPDDSVIRRNDPNAPHADESAWARLLYQSVTAGDPVTLELQGQPGGLD